MTYAKNRRCNKRRKKKRRRCGTRPKRTRRRSATKKWRRSRKKGIHPFKSPNTQQEQKDCEKNAQYCEIF